MTALGDVIRIVVVRLLIMALVGLLAALGLYFVFDLLFQDGPILPFALIGGGLIGVASGLLHTARDWLARRKLLTGAVGRADGQGVREVALRGRIVAREAPLHLPFWEVPLVAAQYSVTAKGQGHVVHRSKGSSANLKHVHMAGLVATPTALRLDGGDITLFGFPSPTDFPEVTIPAAPLAKEILAHAARPGITRPQGFSPADALALLNSYAQDQGGNKAEEFALPSLPDALAQPDALLKMQAIPDRAEVCVIGTYDPAAGGLVANFAWGGIGIYPGDAAEARALLLRRAVGTGLAAAAMAGIATIGLGILLALFQVDDATRLTELQNHIRFGRIEAARPLLEQGLARDPALQQQMVADAPNGPTLALLAQYGADLDSMDANGVPLLIAAAQRGDFERLHDLLEAGAAREIRGGPGYLTALEWAADRGDVFMADFLQTAGVPGQVARQSAMTLIEDMDHPAFTTLRGLYDSPSPFPHVNGFGLEDQLEFEGGMGDDDIVTLFVNNGVELRAHVMQRRGSDWEVLRITRIDPQPD